MRTIAVSLAVLVACGCIPVTVNLTFAFPPKEMEEKLIEMERRVREAERKSGGNAVLFDAVLDVDGTQDVNITVETPAIKEINERRKKRSADLRAHFAAGRIGEAKDAKVAVRDAGDLSGKAKADFNKAVNEENQDRESLIKEILKANKLKDDQLENVRFVYAKALRKVAEIGWWIESPKGKWLKKTDEIQKKLDKDEEIDG